ncbi:uncharacterized protein [Polyergus mexicanus]|uniref:uncharacterized protein n=1 Tax=Polyergus mexicanus TaxID=615972 RepID=UPI0038B5B9EA
MSRDIAKTRCTDCQGRVEASFVPSASLFPVHMKKPDESNESNDWQKSVRPATSSVAITYTSDTDGWLKRYNSKIISLWICAYETSSEGVIPLKRSDTEIDRTQTKESLCIYFKNKSTSLSKLVAFNKNVPSIKGDVISDLSHEFIENRLIRETTMENKTTRVHGSLIFVSENLAKSKSMPILKSEISSTISTNFKAMDVALISESSFAREKKMSMIVKRMTPVIFSTVFLTRSPDTTTNFHGQKYEVEKKIESRTMPILCNTISTAVINDEKPEEVVAEVTFHKTKSNRAMNWDSYRAAIPTFVNNESVGNLTNDGDLIDVARNSHSSIKSVYFPPNPSDPPALPSDSAKSKKHQRVSTDVEALLKIDCELSPLRYQYSEIIGKTRALGLNGMGFDLGISSCLDQPDNPFDQLVLSPKESNYFLNPDRTCLPRAAMSCSFENRSGLVDNTSPSPTFSVVDKPIGSRTSCLNDSSGSRQKALSFAVRDLSRTVENLNGLQSCNRVRKNTSYLPASNSHASQEENVLNKRFCDERISINNSQPYRKSNTVIKGAVSTLWDGWSVHERVNTSLSNVLCKTEYNSHRYLNRTVENSRISNNNLFQVRKQESSVFIMIDDNWPIVDEETTKERLNKRFEIFPDNQNSMVQTEVAIRNNNHSRNILPETKPVVEADRTSSPFQSKLIDHCTGRDRQMSRAVSASTCTPQICVNSNTKFCTTVEKHYTTRANSPIRNFKATSSNNMLLGARVSSIFMQQVHADSTEVLTIEEPPSQIRSIEIKKRNDAAIETRKRDFCLRKVDSQRKNADDLSRFPRFEKDRADLTTERKEAQHLRPSREKITIVPIVLTDGIPEPPRIADVDFAIPRYINKMAPQLSYQFIPFEARRSQRMPSSSNTDNEVSRGNAADSVCLTDKLRSADEKYRRMHRRTSVSRADHHSSLYTQEDHASSNVAGNSKRSTRVTASSARVGEKMREYCKSVAKAIPGMRSSPEDFLCET